MIHCNLQLRVPEDCTSSYSVAEDICTRNISDKKWRDNSQLYKVKISRLIIIRRKDKKSEIYSNPHITRFRLPSGERSTRKRKMGGESNSGWETAEDTSVL